MFRAFHDVATSVDLDASLTGQPWRTGTAKLLDNAVIGYCKVELTESAGPWVDQAADAELLNPVQVLSFTVPGLPPAKNTATSMLSESHEHAPRVRALLATAEVALIAEPGFAPIEAGHRVALDVCLRPAAGVEGWDATNYLGGIGDALEDKSTRSAAIEHLGALAEVWLFRNDRQIKQVRWVEDDPSGSTSSYEVTVWELPAEARAGGAIQAGLHRGRCVTPARLCRGSAAPRSCVQSETESAREGCGASGVMKTMRISSF